MTKTRTITNGALWNLAGQGFPLVIAVLTVPLLIKQLGVERFGIFMLITAILNYFRIFDFGLGLAVTHHLAGTIKEKAKQRGDAIVGASLLSLLILGGIAAVISVSIFPWLMEKVLNIPEGLKREAIHSVILLSLCTPIITLTSGVKGILSAYQRFDLINIIQIPIGALTFIGPLVVSYYRNDLFIIVIIVMILQFLLCLAYAYFAFKETPHFRENFQIKMETLRGLFKFGGWMTASNLVDPFMVYFDRFVIGAVLSITAVAYYTTPYDMITRLWIIPQAFCGPLFTLFSIHKEDIPTAQKLFFKGLGYIFRFLFPIIIVIILFADKILTLWIGADFAAHSSLVLQLLAFGVFINSMAWVCINLIIGLRRPDLPAKLHIIEMPLYVVLLWFLIKYFGINGAALAWVIRVVFDTAILFVISSRMLKLNLFFKAKTL